MHTPEYFKRGLLVALVSGLMACDQKVPTESKPSQDNAAAEQIMKELKGEGIREFAKTANDTHDINVLSDYEDRFEMMSSELENELVKLQQDGELDDAFVLQRQKDLTLSALNMLKDLELKTEQGRYIQGLYYHYWEQQQQLLAKDQTPTDKKSQASLSMKGLAQYLQAQEQLEHWRTEYPKAK